jgi:hypothetical protein
MARQHWRVRDGGGMGKVRTSVRTGFAGLHPAHEKRPGKKTQCWRGVAADSLPELQKSTHQRFPHSLMQRTQLDVTFREARTRVKSYVELRLLRQTRRFSGTGLQKLDTLGRSDHALTEI